MHDPAAIVLTVRIINAGLINGVNRAADKLVANCIMVNAHATGFSC